jgi:hypothetical protein
MMALLLTVALMIIFTAAILPTIKFEIEHDREQEMIHRGVQNSRAIRAYYKKFGRYPARIEDLESTNNMRFLRKRYKDPMNCQAGKCQDFKLLHLAEVRLAFGGGMMPSAHSVASPGAVTGGGAFAQNSTFTANTANSGWGGASSFGQNQPAGQPPSNQAGAPDPSRSSAGSTDQNSTTGSQPGSSSDSSSNNSTGSNLNGFSGQVFGGGPIVGVVSVSKKEGYREFNHKKKYSEWQFIYDPGTDRGGLLMTPNQPPLIQQQPQNVNRQNSSGTTPAVPGTQNNPNLSGTTGSGGTTPDPISPPPQQ